MSARRGIIRRAVVALAVFLVVVLVVGTGLAIWVLRRPLPATEGTLTIAALGAPVTVTRDERGVPHLWAESDRDLFLAQGFVHAQDRFFEMDYRRHVASGRLSELLGDVAEARTADAVTRTLGWRGVAQEEWDLLGSEARSLLQAYADGVNTYLEGREASELAMEYTVLGLQVEVPDIEPWTPEDSLTWLKAMAWDLKSNYDEELERTRVYRTVGNVERVAELFPAYPYEAHEPVVIPAAPGDGGGPGEAVDASLESGTAGGGRTEYRAAAEAIDTALLALGAVPRLVGGDDGVGSNSFVVSGEHTASGLPLLANDPHLSVGMPGVWHQVGLHCVAVGPGCSFDVSGFSLSGLPGVLIGHNGALAWGLTNMRADVTDFFLERMHTDGTYERGEERVAIESRSEVIEVAGAEPFSLTVQSTIHGPIISGVLDEVSTVASAPVPAGSPPGGIDGYAVALAWTGLEPGRTIEGILALNRATTADDVAAAAALFDVPAQNIVFATADGDIGHQAAGGIPIRSPLAVNAVPVDGTWPRPGWDSTFDWEGIVPAENLPRTLNPGEGFVVAANQAVTVPGGGPFLTADFDHGYRSERIRTLLEEAIATGEDLTVEAANEIMLDTANPLAEVLVPTILRLDIDDAFLREAVDELSLWEGEGYANDVDSSGAAYFNAVWANLVSLTFDDELPDGTTSRDDSRWIRVISVLMEDPRNPWWDDVSTVSITETRDEILLRALQHARNQLTNTLGKDADRWRWGDLHRAHLTHPVLPSQTTPGVLAWLMNPTPVAVAGGSSSVNATGWDASPGEDGIFSYAMTTAPSMRMVVDLEDPNTSTWVVASGTSGHPTSRNYANQLGAWVRGETFGWAFTREVVEEEAVATLTLTPGE
ncbi:MAG: penicillin acylase family protein [Actinomycetota bacterium]